MHKQDTFECEILLSGIHTHKYEWLNFHSIFLSYKQWCAIKKRQKQSLCRYAEEGGSSRLEMVLKGNGSVDKQNRRKILRPANSLRKKKATATVAWKTEFFFVVKILVFLSFPETVQTHKQKQPPFSHLFPPDKNNGGGRPDCGTSDYKKGFALMLYMDSYGRTGGGRKQRAAFFQPFLSFPLSAGGGWTPRGRGSSQKN